MWPMLAGIGPVLGEGEPGAFLDPDGARQRWFYEDGASGLDNGANRLLIVTVNGPPYVLRRPAPPVAVLTGPGTASSGEAMVVAFRGRPETRSFGQPTYGVPTANRGYVLSDGATMQLTVSWDQDREGVVYDAPIVPDERVDGAPGDPAQDLVVAASSAWLLARPACAS
jgi:C-terminal processing protease CtpA/Prc